MKLIGFIENFISFKKNIYCYTYFKSQPASHSRIATKPYNTLSYYRYHRYNSCNLRSLLVYNAILKNCKLRCCVF